MKYLFLFLFFFPLSLLCKAQDTIVKRNGEKITVKLIEINPNDVRYKRLDYLEGPLFRVQKQDIKFIVYANGIKDSFENYVAPLTNKENFPPPDLSIQTSGIFYYYKERILLGPGMLAVARKIHDQKINLMIKKVEEKKFIQNITMLTSVPLFVSGAYLYVTNLPPRKRSPISSSSRINAQQNGEYLMLSGLGCDVVSIYFNFDKRRHEHIVVNAYNKKLLSIP